MDKGSALELSFSWREGELLWHVIVFDSCRGVTGADRDEVDVGTSRQELDPIGDIPGLDLVVDAILLRGEYDGNN